MSAANPKKYVITGAGGFVGRAIAERLAGEGNEVIGVARHHYPELEARGISSIVCDISQDEVGLTEACGRATAVFHAAAKVDMWGRYQDFVQANVIGTQMVIEACKNAGVGRLVFTSSPSVIADGTNLRGVDESHPYPTRYPAPYPATKAAAERMVLAANTLEGLRTIVLRPHLIFGPGDRNFVPTILERARKGKLVQVGDGKNLTDLCFIEDCVDAHLLALAALDENPSACGRAYFISQGEPVAMWPWIDQVLRINGVAPIKRRVPKAVAMSLALAAELASKVLHTRPQLTRFLVSEMTTDHYFNITAAQRDLGFAPSCSVAEALRETFGCS